MAGESYARGDDSRPLLNETVGENLAAMAQRRPDAEALVSPEQGVRYTYRGLDSCVDELAAVLLEGGLAAGDRVGVWSRNCAEWVLLQYATARIGVILVPIDPAFGAPELEHVLRQSGCRTLFAASSSERSDYRAIVAGLRPHVPSLEHVVHLGSPEWDQLRGAGRRAGTSTLRRREVVVRPDDPAIIQYVSGTPGFSNGVTLSHRSILNNGFFVGERSGYIHQDRLCVAVPFHEGYGMVGGNLAATTHGACIVVARGSTEPAALVDVMLQERCTSLHAHAPAFLRLLEHLELERHELAALRAGIVAGARRPAEAMRRIVESMAPRDIAACYGTPETAVVTQTEPGDAQARRVSTVGRAHPHVEIKIVDRESGATVPRGVPGELRARGYSTMTGYWNDATATEQSRDSDGWVRTHDTATMDGDGFVTVLTPAQ